MGIAESLFISVAFLFTNNFSTDIFNNPNKPFLWLVSMSFSRMIAVCLYRLYKKNRKSSKPLDKHEMLMKELLMLEQKDSLKYEYYKNYIESLENMRILYHDLKNHMLVSNYDSSYLEKTKKTLEQFDKIYDTGCDILNILFWEINNEASKYGINFECIVEKVDMSFIDDMDLCSIMGNILDNAIESGKELLNVKRPTICIKIGSINNLIIIKIINDCISSSKIRLNNSFRTTKDKKKLHGIGLNSIKRAVEKYDGHCEFDTCDDQFITEILIPFPIIT